MTILENIGLAQHTTFKVGGAARYFCAAKSIEDLKGALAFARAQSLPFFILGMGSNLLVSDAGFAGLVIRMEMRGASHETVGDSVRVTAWAGEVWDELVAKTVEWGAWGIENLSLVPGTVGAAPVQNIGAYGVEAMNVIESVRVVDAATGEDRDMSNAECRFQYRDSIFKDPKSKNLVIVSVTFKLKTAPAPNLSYKDIQTAFAAQIAAGAQPTQLEIREAVIKIRTGKFPDLAAIGTAGSFWKNPMIPVDHFNRLKEQYPDMPAFPAGPASDPSMADPTRVKVPLAWILDKVCGLKGYSKGGVALFEKQPLVLVAKAGSTATEVVAFEKEVESIVKQKTGVEIEPEIGFLC